VVAPRHFVSAHEHEKSSAWHATYGAAADPLHRMRVAALFRRLKLSQPLAAAQPSPPTSTIVDPGMAAAPPAAPAHALQRGGVLDAARRGDEAPRQPSHQPERRAQTPSQSEMIRCAA
jgi:hypothetical protein